MRATFRAPGPGSLPLTMASVSCAPRFAASHGDLRSASTCGSALASLLSRGWAPLPAARTAWAASHPRHAEADAAAEGAIAAWASHAPHEASSSPAAAAAALPLSWPLPARVGDAAACTPGWALRREGALVEHLSWAPNGGGAGGGGDPRQLDDDVTLAAALFLCGGGGDDTARRLRRAWLACTSAAASARAAAIASSPAPSHLHAAAAASAAARAAALGDASAASESASDACFDPVWACLRLAHRAAAASGGVADADGLDDAPGGWAWEEAALAASAAALRPDTASDGVDHMDDGGGGGDDTGVARATASAAGNAASDARLLTHARLAAAASLARAAVGSCLFVARLSREARAAAAGAASGARASLWELCLFRASSPDARARLAPPHGGVDALPPALAAAAEAERWALASAAETLHAALSDAPLHLPAGRAVLTACGTALRVASLSRALRSWAASLLSLLRSSPSHAPFPSEPVLVAWLHVRDAADALLSAASPPLSRPPAAGADGGADARLRVAEACAVCSARVDACWGLPPGGAFPSPAAWRACGHPPIPGTPAAAASEARLRSLADAGYGGRGGEGGGSASDASRLPAEPSLRAAVADAACFFAWAGHDHGAALGPAEAAALAAAAEARAASASAEAAASQAASAAAPSLGALLSAEAARCCDAAGASSRGVASSFPWRLAAAHPAAASALASSAAVASRRAALPVLAALCSAPDAASAGRVASGAAASALLRHGVPGAARPPLDLAPLLQLRWLADGAREDAAPSAAVAAADAAAASATSAAVHELWFRAHAASWRADAAASAFPAAFDGASDAPSEWWPCAAGPLPLFRPSLCARSAALAAAAVRCPVSGRAAATLILRLAARAHAAGPCGGAGVAAAHGGVALSGGSSGPAAPAAVADAAAIVALTRQLLSCVSHPRGRAAGSEYERAASLLRATLDDAALSPLSPLRPGSAAHESARASGWLRLGAARGAALCHELASDPAAADAVRLSHAGHDAAAAAAEGRLRRVAAELPWAGSGAVGVARAGAAAAEACARVARLAARAVPRPDAGPGWGEARAEVQRFTSGVGCVLLGQGTSHFSPPPPSFPRAFCFWCRRARCRKFGGALPRDTQPYLLLIRSAAPRARTHNSFPFFSPWRVTILSQMGNLQLITP